MKTGGSWRVARGAAVGCAIVLVSVLGHLAAGGSVDLLAPGFLLAACMLTLAAIALSNREWTFWRLLAVLALAQVVIHGAMALKLGPVPMPSAMPGMDMGPGTSSESVMLFAHIGVAVMLAAVLRRGEKWLLAAKEKAGALVPRVFVRQTIAFVCTAFSSTIYRTRLTLGRSVVAPRMRRGPPVCV